MIRSLLLTTIPYLLLLSLFTQAHDQPCAADVVINEIFYHAPDELDRLEYLELTNVGAEEVSLAGWSLAGDVEFVFPAGSTIQPGQFWVLAKDATLLAEFYACQANGEFRKSLSNKGGSLQLRNEQGTVVDTVQYQDRAPWPLAADGYSASLERVSAQHPGDLAANWAPSLLADKYDSAPSGTPGRRNSVAKSALPLGVRAVEFAARPLRPNQHLSVRVLADDAQRVATAELRYRFVAPGQEGEEQRLTLRADGEAFLAQLPTGDAENRLLRFRVALTDHHGEETLYPHPNAIRPTFTVYVGPELQPANIPMVHLFFTDEQGFQQSEQYRQTQRQPAPQRRGFGSWGRGPRPERTRPGETRPEGIRSEDMRRSPRAERGPDRREPDRRQRDTEEADAERGRPVASDRNESSTERARRPLLPTQDELVEDDADTPSREEMRERFRRERFRSEFQRRGDRRGGRGSFRGMFGRPEPTPLRPQGNAALVYADPRTGKSLVFDYVNVGRRKSGWKVRFHKDRHLQGMSTVNLLFEPDQRTVLNEALAYKLYQLAGNKTYQHGFMRVAINGLDAGYHLYFEQPNGNFFKRHGINTDGELYKLIWMGNAEMSSRVPEDERSLRPDITGRYEKKSRRHKGHKHLVSLIEAFESAGSDEHTWQLINQHLELDQVVNYLAVNSLISHWDGYFNNFFVYYDRKGTGKWSMYPWDQDSTWSQRGGRPEELYEMPLFFGAEGATPDGLVKVAKAQREANRGRRGFGFGPGRGFPPRGFGERGERGRDERGRGDDRPRPERRRGFGWWRPGGDLSRPLLANPQFYDRFLQRLDQLTQSTFTQEKFGPYIDALQTELAPEFKLRARLQGQDEDEAVRELSQIIAGLREHLHRRSMFVRLQLTAGNR